MAEVAINERWRQGLDLLCERVLSTRAAVGAAWPHHADPDTGAWATTPDGDWCAGQWVEALRIAGERSGERALIAEARRRSYEIRPRLERDDMFRGPAFYYSAARLWASEQNQAMRGVALAAARTMRGMAMRVNGAMPLGTDVAVPELASRAIVAIDSVHAALLLDWWALKETGDPTYRVGAERHLEAAAQDFIRADGSTAQFVEYDPDTGAVRRRFVRLGRDDEGCWSRGQAWAIGGYLRAFEATRDRRWLAIAERLLDYWWTHTGEDRMPAWDLTDPDPAALRDSSAAAILAESLARLAVRRDLAAEVTPVVARLPALLDGLVARLTPASEGDRRPRGMLLEGAFNHPRRVADRHELIWGDAYLLFALHCLDRKGLPC
jgi:unsaturated chondroitin disaccharide hydrolase